MDLWKFPCFVEHASKWLKILLLNKKSKYVNLSARLNGLWFEYENKYKGIEIDMKKVLFVVALIIVMFYGIVLITGWL